MKMNQLERLNERLKTVIIIRKRPFGRKKTFDRISREPEEFETIFYKMGGRGQDGTTVKEI